MLEKVPMKQPADPAQKMLWHARITTVLIAVIAAAIVFFVFRANAAVSDITAQLTDTVAKATALIDSAQDAVTNLSAVSESLNSVDFASLASDMDEAVSLARNSMESAGETLKNFEKLDIETLNKAIKDLSAIVEPMSNFFRW